MDQANAFMVVAEAQPYVPGISALSRANASSGSLLLPKPRRNRALLLVGSAAKYLRHPQVQLAKGVRVHPYRMVPSISRRPCAALEPLFKNIRT